MSTPDAFSLLQVPRRPWLDPEPLKAQFLTLSAAGHPDHLRHADAARQSEATRTAADLNQAYQRLREPRDRIRHLLELERGKPDPGMGEAPHELMDLFFEVGNACRAVDAHLKSKATATSPMAKAQSFADGLPHTVRLQELLRILHERTSEVHGRLQSMNTAWEQAPPPGHPDRTSELPLTALAEAGRTLSYLTRWVSQVQDRIVQLSL